MSRVSELMLVNLSCALSGAALIILLGFLGAARFISSQNFFNVCLAWGLGFALVCVFSSAACLAYAFFYKTKEGWK